MNVKTAGRTLDLFEAFAREGKPCSLSQRARAIDAPVSSCFGIVRTLEARGYLYEVKARAGFYPTKLLFEHARAIAGHDTLVSELLGGMKLPRLTSRTITSRAALEADLEQGRARGWYLTRGETVADLMAVGVPVAVNGEIYSVA